MYMFVVRNIHYMLFIYSNEMFYTIFIYLIHLKGLIFVTGSFNNWQKLKMSKSTKDFVAIVDLKEGEHEYKFLVDGEWVNDPNEPKVIDATDENGCTVKNNLIRVQKEDFDAYHALDMDSKAVALAQQNHKKRLFSDTFSQEIPQYVTERTEHRTGPPILPPHLLQVILNKVICLTVLLGISLT